MYFPSQLGRQRRPIARDDVREIKMIAPIRRYRGVDGAAQLVEYRLGITVRGSRSEYRLPNIVLAAGTAAVPLRQLHVIGIALSGEDFAQVIAKRRAFDRRGIAGQGVGILVLVEVNDGVGAKVDRIRTCGKRAVVHIRIEDLSGKRLPATGRPAVGKARPSGADGAEAPLDLRYQFLVDGI